MSNAFSNLPKFGRRSGKPGPAKDLGSPPKLLVNTLAIFLISQLIALLAVSLVLTVGSPHGSTKDLFDQSITAQFVYVLLAEGLAVLATLWLVRRRGLDLGFIGLGRRPRVADLSRALVGFVGFYGILIVVGLALSIFVPNFKTDQTQNLGFNHLNGTGDGILAFIALVIFPPLGEEPLVRGYLYSGLRRHWRFVTSMLAASLFFGLAHLEFGSGSPLVWGAAIETFVLSIVLVYLRETTGALYAGILVHMLNNAVAFGVHFH